MIIVKLQGGLGNQMFQYAAGRALSLKFNTMLKLDLTQLLDRTPPKVDFFVFRDYDLDVFAIEPPRATSEEVQKLRQRTPIRLLNKALNKVLGPPGSYLKEPHFHVTPEFFTRQPPLYLDGYWQSEKYFAAYADVIRNDFTFRHPPAEHVREMAQRIRNENAVVVHIRRGDFLLNPLHGTVSTDYLQRAQQLIAERSMAPSYFVFSDDIEWCRENLTFGGPTVFLGQEYAGPKVRDYLYLMTLGKQYIISNSSFSWWATWLNAEPNKTVIAPARWFQEDYDTSDLIPASWIRI